MFAYYDSDADIAWFPTGESDDVVSERVPGGLRDYDRASHKLVAIEDPDGNHFVSSVTCEGEPFCWRLSDPLAYFIPEHVQDPSVRPADEKLWVEVTVPPKGPPRPIQLGVKKDGTLTPLQVRSGDPE